MTPSSKPRRTFRFQDFELDVVAYELRRHGRRVRLERRPMDLLIFMVERRDELITRAEIVERLWGKDVFIEVETAVNTLVRKITGAARLVGGSGVCRNCPGQGLSIHLTRRDPYRTGRPAGHLWY